MLSNLAFAGDNDGQPVAPLNQFESYPTTPSIKTESTDVSQKKEDRKRNFSDEQDEKAHDSVKRTRTETTKRLPEHLSDWRSFKEIEHPPYLGDENIFSAYNSEDVAQDDFKIISSPFKHSLSTWGLASCFAIILRGLDKSGTLIQLGLMHDSLGDPSYFVETFIENKKSELNTLQFLIAGGMSSGGSSAIKGKDNIAKKIRAIANKNGITVVEEGTHIIDLAKYPSKSSQVPKFLKNLFLSTTDHYETGYSAAVIISEEGLPYYAVDESGRLPEGAGAIYNDFLITFLHSDSLMNIILYMNNLKNEDKLKLMKTLNAAKMHYKKHFLSEFLLNLEKKIKKYREKNSSQHAELPPLRNSDGYNCVVPADHNLQSTIRNVSQISSYTSHGSQQLPFEEITYDTLINANITSEERTALRIPDQYRSFKDLIHHDKSYALEDLFISFLKDNSH